jgi:hypothetical protein
MTLTATFKKYESKKVIGPRGGEKWVHDVVEVVDTLHPVTVSFGGITKTLYTRGMDATKEYNTLYQANGEIATGIWHHGRYGSKMHHEAIQLRNGKLQSVSSYASGQIKDQHKYLKSI